MTAYGAILASGPRKVVVIVPPDDDGFAGVALDLATGELVPLGTPEGITWQVLAPISFQADGRTLHGALGDSVSWIIAK